MALQSTWGPSQHLCKQSAVMTVEVATMLWPCGGLYLEEVRHMDVKVALCGVWSSSGSGAKSAIYDCYDIHIGTTDIHEI